MQIWNSRHLKRKILVIIIKCLEKLFRCYVLQDIQRFNVWQIKANTFPRARSMRQLYARVSVSLQTFSGMYLLKWCSRTYSQVMLVVTIIFERAVRESPRRRRTNSLSLLITADYDEHVEITNLVWWNVYACTYRIANCYRYIAGARKLFLSYPDVKDRPRLILKL